MGKIKPLWPRADPPPSQHLRRKQDEAIPSSRHVRKDKYRKGTRERHKPFGGPPKNKRKDSDGTKCRREGKIKLLLPDAIAESHSTPNPKGYRGRQVGDGLSPVIGDELDFSMGQGGSSIP